MNCRILVIDEEAAVRHALRGALTDQDYELEEAEDGSTALARLEEVRPQIVISDVNMPGMEIVSLLEKVQKMDESPLVILIATMASKEKAIQRSYRSGEVSEGTACRSCGPEFSTPA